MPRQFLQLILFLALFLGATQESRAFTQFAKFVPDTTARYSELILDEFGRPRLQLGGDMGSTNPIDHSISFTYDANGNVLTVKEGTATLTRTYDSMNRPVSYTNNRGETIGYQYNANGQLWKLIYPGNRVVTYEYNKANRLKTVTDWTGRKLTYTWDKNGNNTKIVRANGSTTLTTRVNTYDAAGRLTNYEEYTNKSLNIITTALTYDADGRLTKRVRNPVLQESFYLPVTDTNTQTYDADNRLTVFNGASVTHDNDGNMTSYGYIPYPGFVGPIPPNQKTTYTYDNACRVAIIVFQIFRETPIILFHIPIFLTSLCTLETFTRADQ